MDHTLLYFDKNSRSTNGTVLEKLSSIFGEICFSIGIIDDRYKLKIEQDLLQNIYNINRAKISDMAVYPKSIPIPITTDKLYITQSSDDDDLQWEDTLASEITQLNKVSTKPKESNKILTPPKATTDVSSATVRGTSTTTDKSDIIKIPDDEEPLNDATSSSVITPLDNVSTKPKVRFTPKATTDVSSATPTTTKLNEASTTGKNDMDMMNFVFTAHEEDKLGSVEKKKDTPIRPNTKSSIINKEIKTTDAKVKAKTTDDQVVNDTIESIIDNLLIVDVPTGQM